MCICGVVCSGRECKIVQEHSCCLPDFPQNREQGFCLIIYPRGRGDSSSFFTFCNFNNRVSYLHPWSLDLRK